MPPSPRPYAPLPYKLLIIASVKVNLRIIVFSSLTYANRFQTCREVVSWTLERPSEEPAWNETHFKFNQLMKKP